MKCSEVINNLVDFATGKIESTEIAEHLKVCKSCGKEFDNIKKVVLILNDYKFEEPSEFYFANFLNRIKVKIAESERSVKGFAIKPVFLVPSLVIVIIGLLLGVVFSNLFMKQEQDYISQVLEINTQGVLIKPSELSGISDETIEQAISYLYWKYQIPEFDHERYEYQDIDVEEVLKRISNKF